MSTVQSRVYLVTDNNGGGPYLINATNPAQAIRHVMRKQFSAVVASQQDLIQHLPDIDVETAGAEPAVE